MRPTFVRAFSNNCLDDIIESEINRPSAGPELPATNGPNGGDEGQQPRQFIVAVDFGTTSSAVAYTVLRPGEDRTMVDIHQISSISLYPGSGEKERGLTTEVPTETCYPLNARPRQADSAEAMDVDPPARSGANLSLGVLYRSSFQRITRSKLLLDKTDYTRELREQLQATAENLAELGIINDSMDLIVDFLSHLLAHTKAQLISLHMFNDNDSVEWVLCVPVVWRRRAVRKMQDALIEASRRSLFGRTISNSVENLYIVSKPEAAAAHVLASTREVKAGDTFMVLDAGGGTVDAVIYKLRNTEPLQLEKEAVKPEGALCGSSYLNERCEEILRDRLKDETYLTSPTPGARKAITMEGIIASQVWEFETKVKRNCDIMDSNFTGHVFFIQGLRENKAKNFTDHRLRLDQKEFKDIFRPCLEGTSRLMLKQLQAARQKGIIVKAILRQRSVEIVGSPVGLLRPNVRLIVLIAEYGSDTAVASGAVLRALNQELGPIRIIQSSYGYLCTEPWDPELIKAHNSSKPKQVDPNNGDLYVKNTICWVLKKGDEVPPFAEYRFRTLFTFPANTKQRFKCNQHLYVSDMTFLRTEGHIRPVKPDNELGRRHYRVEYDLVMIVDGYNIRYEARWDNGQGEQVHAEKQINIAAAFASLEPEWESDEDGEEYLTDLCIQSGQRSKSIAIVDCSIPTAICLLNGTMQVADVCSIPPATHCL
ncbi:HSP70 family protein [Aspergillus fumigatus]|uniref:HSP70 family protein n=1 Tax=Aspergillus fumigatus (strain CBS 144.89 / FGSC A1163 / CEA10) TaxID=451804 RepID=B0Y0B8_ASPFC|nr:HSP70 family protein [Aspergillus fumigatus A1163]